MRKMQEIQPETKAIQDRYAKLKATDPAKQKMNQELMALYRERGVNPASGCVPMLLTLPVLLAFYSLLTTAIELRGAPFVRLDSRSVAAGSVLRDADPDGHQQIWQQWMTPQAGIDPAQQKMMMFMPIIFMFVFLWAPAGVADLLAGRATSGHRSAVPDELLDRSAEYPDERPPAERE